MNILFVSPTPFHPFRGGVGRVTYTLTKEFQKRGYQIFYLHQSWYMEDRKQFEYPATVAIFPSKDIFDSQNIKFYHDFILANRIDIIINQDGLYEGSYLFLNSGNIIVKKISVIHNNPIINYDYLWSDACRLKNNKIIEKIKRVGRCCLFYRTKLKMLRHLKVHYQFIEKNSDKIILLSDRYVKSLKKIGLNCPKKIYSISNPNTYENILERPQKRHEIIYIGRLSTVKRIDRLLKIWSNIYKEFPDWNLLIVGDGEESCSLKIKAKKLNLKRVSFMGFQDPRPFYERASIICMTSDYEGFPMVLTEAMQFGCVPVVYNSFEAIEDIVKSGFTGELIHPFNEKEFIYKIKNLMKDDLYLDTLSKNAFHYVKKYDVKNIVDQWVKLFCNL